MIKLNVLDLTVGRGRGSEQGGDLNFFQKSLLIRAYLHRIQRSLNFSEIILTASLQSQVGTGGGGQF